MMARRTSGFTMVELLVAMALTLLIASAIVGLAIGADRLARTQSRMIDAQQRGRVVAEMIGRDLRLAGAGVDRGPMVGALAQVVPAVWPRRLGRQRADTFTTARPDVIAMFYVPDSTVQTSLAEAYAPALGRVLLAPCATGAACRIARGTSLIVLDPSGRVELLGVLAGTDGLFDVRTLGGTTGALPVGTTVAELVVRTYYFDAASFQIRLYDGDGSDQPVIDDVAGMRVEYFGDPHPPWPGGATLAVEDGGLARLPLAMFVDGPWWGAGGTTFDADLLRVRRVRVTAQLRVSAAREPLPDVRVVIEVSPPNLALVGGVAC
jgi:prepilin-type N-terminal cleavage/methylation domain-containing protein